MFAIGVSGMRAHGKAQPGIIDTTKWNRDYLIAYYNRPNGYSGD